MSASKHECLTHHKILESFCKSCKISACKDCEHFASCLKNTRHDVIPMRIAVDAFNKEANETIKIAKDIKEKLEDTFNSIFDDKADFASHLQLCRTSIEVQTKTIIEKVQEKSNELMLDLDNIYKQKIEAIESQVKELESKQLQVQCLKASVIELMDKPEDMDKLVYHKTSINAVRQTVLETGFDKSCHKRNLTPNFIPCTHLDEGIHMNGIGKIACVDNRYTIDKDDETMTVIKGQPFTVKVTRMTESDTCKLVAILRNSSGEESATEVEDKGNGEYNITGRCQEEGHWQMEITAGVTHIKGSSLNIKVEKRLVNTICNIADYKKHEKENTVIDVVLDTDGCILVSSDSKEILKFKKTGRFVARIELLDDVMVGIMHQLGNGHMLYSDVKGKRVVMCDDQFKEIRSFGKGMLKFPMGLAVNKEARILYATDRDNHCVFKFNVDDMRMLGKIGSEGIEEGQMKGPIGVTLTKEGHVIVADCLNNRIQIFDANDKFMRILVGCGKEDGKVWYTCGVTMDMAGNMIVSSDRKLQLFDKNGVFIKRIGDKDDGLYIPLGICVISNRPRRVAVANRGANNVKIFNY